MCIFFCFPMTIIHHAMCLKRIYINTIGTPYNLTLTSPPTPLPITTRKPTATDSSHPSNRLKPLIKRHQSHFGETIIKGMKQGPGKLAHAARRPSIPIQVVREHIRNWCDSISNDDVDVKITFPAIWEH